MSRMVKMSRVVSKNLFDFKPAGKVDDDVTAMFEKYEKMGEGIPEVLQMQERMKELLTKEDEESNREYLTLVRQHMQGMEPLLNSNPFYNGVSEQIVRTDLAVPTDHDGEFDVPVEVYTPKSLEGQSKRAAYIYAHGGGVIAMTAGSMSNPLCKFALDNDLVVFNVDYRLAPETKCPNNAKDFYEVVKHVHQNAESLGIDPAKICIAGDSGGGYICLATMVLLAQHDESEIIKLALPGIPMVDDYCFSDPLAMTVEERKDHLMMRKFWNYIAADWEAQKHDPLLFPGKASEELLEKFPPTIVMEAEFDMFITEATRLANRLRRAGRLLELVVIPGSTHGAGFICGVGAFNVFWDTMNTIAREYIHG